MAATSTLSHKLVPFMAQLVEYMLASNEHADPGVALAAAEYWTAYLDLQLDPAGLRPYLPRLIPVLLKNMVRRMGWGGAGQGTVSGAGGAPGPGCCSACRGFVAVLPRTWWSEPGVP